MNVNEAALKTFDAASKKELVLELRKSYARVCGLNEVGRFWSHNLHAKL